MSKPVPFQTIKFSISKQFKCKFSLIVKNISIQAIQFSQTILIQTIQFSTSLQFSSIQPIDRALSSATISGLSGPGSNGNKGVLYIPPKPQYYWNLAIRLFCVISRTHVVGGSTPLQRSNWCNVQLQVTGQNAISTFTNYSMPKS